MLHFYGNLLYLLVLFFSSYLIAFYDYLKASVCVKNHSLSAFSGALVLVKKKEKVKAVQWPSSAVGVDVILI